jgi:hypothetical protein
MAQGSAGRSGAIGGDGSATCAVEDIGMGWLLGIRGLRAIVLDKAYAKSLAAADSNPCERQASLRRINQCSRGFLR